MSTQILGTVCHRYHPVVVSEHAKHHLRRSPGRRRSIPRDHTFDKMWYKYDLGLLSHNWLRYVSVTNIDRWEVDCSKHSMFRKNARLMLCDPNRGHL